MELTKVYTSTIKPSQYLGLPFAPKLISYLSVGGEWWSYRNSHLKHPGSHGSVNWLKNAFGLLPLTHTVVV